MRKTILAVLSLVFMTSCIGALKKKINETLGSDSVANTDVKDDSKDEVAVTENFEDLPLYVFGLETTSDWYVPLGYEAQSRFTSEEFEALSDEQMSEEFKRQEKVSEAFFNMLKKNKERYVTVLCDNKKIAVNYVSCNFDKGSSNVVVFGNVERINEKMKYVRFTNSDKHRNKDFWHGMLLTENFLKTHKLYEYKNKCDRYGNRLPGKKFAETARMTVEQKTGKKVKSARLNCEIDGGKYCFYTILFENETNKAFAMQVVTTPDGVAMGEMEEAEIDEYGDAGWAVDMEGEYPSMDIVMAEEHNGTLNLWYLDRAPEHVVCGVFAVKGNKLLMRTYYSYYVSVD